MSGVHGRMIGRQAFTADSLGLGLLQPGVVVEVGRDGLTIRTPAPNTLSADVHIEIVAEKGDRDGPLLLRGRVARVTPDGQGEHLMEVRLMSKSVPPKDLPLYVPPPTGGPELADPGEVSHPSDPDPEPAPARPRKGRKLLILLMLVLLILLLWAAAEVARRLVVPPSEPQEPAPRLVVRTDNGMRPAPAAGLRPPDPDADTEWGTLQAVTVGPRPPVQPSPTGPAPAAGALAGAPPGSGSGTAGLPQGLPPLQSVEPIDLASVPPGVALPGVVAALAFDAIGRPGEAPAPAAASSSAASGGSGATQDAPPVPGEQDGYDDVRVVVDRASNRLTLYSRGEAVRSFPVGLGRDDSTPVGEFQVVSKVTDPDWRHRGRIIPGGSPENRLGRRWMGLGTDGRATSYGIHPAKNPQTIGKNLSLGCIQMQAEDADLLFRFCPVGTPVSILP